MPGKSTLSMSVPSFPKFNKTMPDMSPLTSGRPITSDGNGTANSGRAAGSELLTRMLANTSRINGLGGKLDLMA